MMSKRDAIINGGGVLQLATGLEVAGVAWRNLNFNNCPVIAERNGGKWTSRICWCKLNDGVCPEHGRIYDTTTKG